MTTAAKKAQEFIDWLTGLTDQDVTNFIALLALGPSAINRLPDSDYKQMARIGLALVESGKNDIIKEKLKAPEYVAKPPRTTKKSNSARPTRKRKQ